MKTSEEKDEAMRRSKSLAVQRKSMSDERLMEIIMEACHQFEGDSSVLETAIGALCWGRVVGWHGLRLMHSSRTFKRYEEILGIRFRDELPERTVHSTRMNGIKLAENLGKFWQVITAGQVKAKDAREATAL